MLFKLFLGTEKALWSRRVIPQFSQRETFAYFFLLTGTTLPRLVLRLLFTIFTETRFRLGVPHDSGKECADFGTFAIRTFSFYFL